MPRTKLSLEVNDEKPKKKVLDLDQLIVAYGRYNTNYKELKGLVDTYNADIKKVMKEQGITTKETNGWKAVYSVQKRESMNEDKLLEILRNNGIESVIKTREYVDFDALEDAIYKGDVPKEVLLTIDTCREVKEVETLKVTKLKKE